MIGLNKYWMCTFETEPSLMGHPQSFNKVFKNDQWLLWLWSVNAHEFQEVRRVTITSRIEIKKSQYYLMARLYKSVESQFHYINQIVNHDHTRKS